MADVAASPKCTKIELAHDQRVPCQIDIDRSTWIEHYPRSGLTDQSAPLEFFLESDSNDWGLFTYYSVYF